ncbi:SidA/IucD/PvdA family monooxygenase [Streptomyces sp. NPDC003660]
MLHRGWCRHRGWSSQAFASSVVVASGMDGFAHVPRPLAPLVPEGLVSHASHHADLSGFAERAVVVVGAGQSAQESAALLHEAGADAQLLARVGAESFAGSPLKAAQ